MEEPTESMARLDRAIAAMERPPHSGSEEIDGEVNDCVDIGPDGTLTIHAGIDLADAP
jgi:hypothetical protein